MQVLHTPRIRLEPLCVSHAPEMFALLRDPRIYTFLTRPPPASLEALTERYQRLQVRQSPDGSERWLNWIIRLSEGAACVGFVQATLYTPICGDFGFILGPGYWGHGFAYEAAAATLATLFADYGMKSLFATVDPQNSRSIALLRRLGFRRVEHACYPHGEVLAGDDVFQLDAAVAKA